MPGGPRSRAWTALETRLVPLPAPRHVLRLGTIKPALHVADGEPDGAVADRLALERSRQGGNERVAVARKEGGGGVGDGEKLRLT